MRGAARVASRAVTAHADRYAAKVCLCAIARYRSTAGSNIIGEPTIADAILDRIVHNAHRLKLKGDSLRRKLTAQQSAA